jgi:hypothetical protein
MAVTETEGGAMLGYWAIGSRVRDRMPPRPIRSAITHAKTGRSMKKRAMAGGPAG